jgi:hypothetical protein
VNYLKNNGKHNQKGNEGEEKSKIRLVREIIHHWKVDNRYISKTEEDEFIDYYPQRK